MKLTTAIVLCAATAEAGKGKPLPGPYVGYGGYPGGYHPSYYPSLPKNNPWGAPQPTVDKTGWYSQYQQYSPPLIQYWPAYLQQPVFASCASRATDAEIQLVQFPGMPVQARWFSPDLYPSLDGQVWTVRIYEYGRLGGDECTDIGAEFNPLTERNKRGEVNPFQDPSRGRINDITFDSDGMGTIASGYILQNLSGENSIIGRSLLVGVEGSPIGCCTIGLMAAPEGTGLPEGHVYGHGVMDHGY